MHSSSEKNACLFDIPRSKWNINQNKTWLKLCGLETKANATTLHETVDHYINDKNCPLPFNERRGRDIDNMVILWMSYKSSETY